MEIMNRKIVLKLIYSILNDKVVERRFWNTCMMNDKTGEVTANLDMCITLVTKLLEIERDGEECE